LFDYVLIFKSLADLADSD